MKTVQRFILLLSIFALAICIPISSNLFNIDLLGIPTSVNFINEKELLISSSKGLVTKVDLNSGKIMWRKNMIYPVSLKLSTVDKCNLFVNQSRFLSMKRTVTLIYTTMKKVN